MSEELNTLSYDNTKVTFTPNVNNIATSDELTAAPLYQDKMGTAYSKSKAVVRAFNVAGISLILTAAAIKTGSLIANAFVLNPPSLSAISYRLENKVFGFEFTVSNPGEYLVEYYLYINDIETLKVDCSEPTTYVGEYDKLNIGDKGLFYVQFTNRVDYQKIIERHTFTVTEE